MKTARRWVALWATVGSVAACVTGGPEWSVVAFQGATNLDTITSVDGRLVMTGAVAEGPAAWISHDGLGWERSAVAVHNQENLDAEFLSMGVVSGHGDHLVAVGHRHLASRDYWETVIWISRDGGQSWEEAPNGPVPQGTLDVVATDVGYLALGQGPNGVPAVWTSATGVGWQLAADESAFGNASVSAIAALEGRIVAVGARLDQAGPGPAMAWLSSDGAQWEPIILSGRDAGNAVDVIATDAGFVAVGSQLGDLTGAVAWQSSNGRTWQSVVLDRSGEIWAGLVAASGGQFVAIGGRSLGRGTGLAAWFVLSPSQPPIPLDLEGGLRGITNLGDRYVAIASCGGPFEECLPQLIYGLPPGTPQPELGVL